MKVAHITVSDSQGTAAQAVRLLLEGMTALGHDARVFACQKNTGNDKVIPLSRPAEDLRQASPAQREAGMSGLYSTALLDVCNHPFFQDADIVHLHAVDGDYFSFLLLPFLTARKPTVWTLHDSSILRLHDQSPAAVRELQLAVCRLAGFTVTTAGSLLKQQAETSLFAGKSIGCIADGIDTNRFEPGNKARLRWEHRLPPGNPLVVFGGEQPVSPAVRGILDEALRQAVAAIPGLTLLYTGTDPNEIAGLPLPCLTIPQERRNKLLAAYYAAGDVLLVPAFENNAADICQAMACGLPVVGFSADVMPELVMHGETGFLAADGTAGGLAEGIKLFFEDAALREKAGQLARLQVVRKFNAKHMTEAYLKLYTELAEQTPPAAGEMRPSVAPVSTSAAVAGERPIKTLEDLAAQIGVLSLAELLRQQGWDAARAEFERILDGMEAAPKREVFIDLFGIYALQLLDPIAQGNEFWQLIALWHSKRKLPARAGGLTGIQLQILTVFCETLRERLVEYFQKTPLTGFAQMTDQRASLLIALWRQIFLNAFSPLVLGKTAPHPLGEKLLADTGAPWYPRLLLAGMYRPFDADKARIDFDKLLGAKQIPFIAKILLQLWAVSTPYFNAEERHRLKLTASAAAICRSLLQSKAVLPQGVFQVITEEIMGGFWRASYIGGNHVRELSLFGDYISTHMRRYYPQYAKKRPKKQAVSPNRKIRIGYISRNFCAQAVSYYMVNRLIHHDRDKFEVFVFALGDRHDEMTERFISNCEHFQQLKNIGDLAAISRAITASNLDLLIYCDIGMDPVTYMLAALQLVPVQAVLVGHGTTSGLATIQYYISGDFESDEADSHYREKLIRLPNLGAAQFPPTIEVAPHSRAQYKIPEDAVVFVSCANGIKHGPKQDAALIEILRRAPNAYIVLKPFQNPPSVNPALSQRLMAAAEAAGVQQRLRIVPPLRKSNEIMGLLAIADLQLDTYPYGGWTTNMEALYMGLPIVTREGDMMRSRWGAHLLRAIGINEGIAANREEYIEWAVRYACDAGLLKRNTEIVKEKARKQFFDGAAAQPAYERVLEEICGSDKR